MRHAEALDFFMNIMKNMQLKALIAKEPYEDMVDFENEIQKMITPGIDYSKCLRRFCDSCEDYTIYKVCGESLLQYVIMRLPDEDETTCLVVGPYALAPWKETEILNKAQEFGISPECYPAFRKCYESVPIITDSAALDVVIQSLAASIWKSEEAFTVYELSSLTVSKDDSEEIDIFDYVAPNELHEEFRKTEEKYISENELFRAVSNGQIHQVQTYLNRIKFQIRQQCMTDRLRSAKNSGIILNTLLRRVVENCEVHPFYIDKLFSSFMKKIELQLSVEGVMKLFQEIVIKYTMLVKNRSLCQYSPLIRKVMVNIDKDLTGDLTLRTQARLLEVNPSYLSSAFKKETGFTLTEYVTRKRMEYARFLLDSTNMRIQTIASYCGIPDICYFTKIFKRQVGMSPTEYRRDK
ncbi:MAG: AraC family transcriptional regulator [Eubacterium sp.]|nr:AraC family transcriptional regulator [Eubacterium sp.]